jgi:hypothetical protein
MLQKNPLKKEKRKKERIPYEIDEKKKMENLEIVSGLKDED